MRLWNISATVVSVSIVGKSTLPVGQIALCQVKTWGSVCKHGSRALGNYGHLSYEKQQELLREIGGIDIGAGTLQTTNQRVFEAVHPVVNELRNWVQQQPHVHVDESPWPVLGVKEWL